MSQAEARAAIEWEGVRADLESQIAVLNVSLRRHVESCKHWSAKYQTGANADESGDICEWCGKDV